MLNFEFYTGKVNNDARQGQGQGYQVVTSLSTQYMDKWHWIAFDNLFTSIPLVMDLMDKKTYSVGTFRKNRKGYPWKGEKKKDKKGTTKQKQCGNLVATRWTDKREVNMLSTCADPGSTEVVRKSKDGPVDVLIPNSVKLYNQRMGGVDLADQYR